MRQEYEALKATSGVIHLDLKNYGAGSQGQLERDLFESTEFAAYLEQGSELLLLLDCLDEGRIQEEAERDDKQVEPAAGKSV